MASDKKTNKREWADCQDLIDEWDSSKRWTDQHTGDFTELSNLADGISLSKTKGAPVVGDVTLMTSVRQIPRASIQQLPTFSVEVNGTKQSFYAAVCDFIVRRIVFNQDTFGKGILSTAQIGAESALTLGFQSLMASVGNVLTEFGTSMKLIHYNDIGIEKGVFDGADSSYFYVRTRVTKARLEELIKSVEKNPDKSTWNLEALKALKATGTGGDVIESMLSDARSRGGIDNDDGAYDIITKFPVGPYATYTTFTPGIRKPLRKVVSKSKFGYPRVQMLVLDPAQMSPFGISRVRLASPAANYANIYLQSTAKMQLLNADPPIFQRGQFTAPVRLRRGVTWQALDPNAEVKLQELSNSTLTQFRNVLEFVDNQIYSVMGVTPGSMGAQANGGVYQNKTASSMEKNVSDLSATQVTNIIENTLRQFSLTAVDLYISEQVGTKDLIVDDQCKNAINSLAESKFVPEIDPASGMALTQFVPPIGDDNKIRINWKDFYKAIETWTVDIDLSMSKDSMDEKKRADLQDMLTVVSQTSDPADPVAQGRKRQLEDALLEKTLPELSRSSAASGMSAAAPMAQPEAGPAQPPQA